MRAWRGRLLAGLLLATALYVAFAVVADVRELRQAMEDLDGRALVVAVALSGACIVLRGLRWRLYLHRIDARVAFVPGFAMGLAGGKGGQVVKAYYLQENASVPYHVSIPATLAERMSDMAALVALLVLGLLLAPGIDLRAPLAGLALVALFTWALRSERLVHGLVGRLDRWPRLAAHAHPILLAHARLRGHLSLGGLAAPAAMGLSGFAFEAMALQAILVSGFGLPFTWGETALLLALIDLAGVVSLLPGGVGAAEGSLVVLLVARDVPLAVATATTLLFRITTLWLGVLVGALAAAALESARRSGRPAKA